MTIQVTGKCDAKCGKDAKHWLANTSSAYCGDRDCLDKLNASYQAGYEEMVSQNELEQEMIAQWGDPSDY